VRAFLLGPVVRLVPVGLIFLALQRAVFAEYRLKGVALQVVLALVAAAGAGGGPERGALAGFVLGMMYDLGVGTPLGLTALAYGLAGLVAGYVILITPDPQWWFAMIFVALGAAVGEVAIAVTKLLIGEEGWVDASLFKVVPIVAAFAALLSPVLVPVGRWCMYVRRPKWKAIPE